LQFPADESGRRCQTGCVQITAGGNLNAKFVIHAVGPFYNEKYVEAIRSPQVPVPAFNPASPPQKQKLFDWLGLKSDKTSKETGLPSWDRDEIERVNLETADPDIKHFTQCFIDHSFAAIVRNNFINAFYKYTVNNRLHGQYKLLGAKSGRYTSSNPNMLNTPSTGSIFSKPIKQCFTAPPGFLIAAIDYAA
jgi:DNA polymerase I-like protein with 3'-5' exonuclease and polymerase domains